MADDVNERARRLVLEHGWNSTCYQILNSTISRWFSQDGRGCVGYVCSGNLKVVAGAPVCREEDLPRILAEFEAECALAGHGVCYFGAEGRMGSYAARAGGYARVVLGAQPEWAPSQFLAGIEASRSLRAQLNRARNKGVSVAEWLPSQSRRSQELRDVLDDWLGHKGLPPLHFLVEPYTLDDTRDRRIFVASAAGRVLAFVTLCPVPGRNGWLTEQFVHREHVPNGTVDLSLYEAARAVNEAGSTYFTMGIVPLSPHGPKGEDDPGWLQAGGRWVRSRGARLYNFEGLDAYKSKFRPPHWEPVLALSREGKFSYRTLRAIGAAFADGQPEAAVIRGLLRVWGRVNSSQP